MTRLAQWWNERVPLTGEQLRELTNEPVPNHMKRWWFCLGGTPAYLFVVQIVTGIMLAIYYQPSAASAYESVQHITNDVAYGWFFRSMHKWAATLMIASVVLHQMRIYFTAAYSRPRELNWIIGMCLLLLSLGLGFTGYSLVFEQLSYWGATVGGNLMDTVPGGNFFKQMLLAGPEYNQQTLSRFYILHAAIMPTMLVMLIGVHIALIRLHGITELQFDDEPKDKPKHFNFFPDHIITELGMGLVLMVLLSALSTIFPATLGPKANPNITPEHIKPEWFFYATFRWLKLFGQTFAVLSMGLIVFVMFLWPWIDRALIRLTRRKDISIYIGIVAVLLLVGLTVWEAAATH